MIEGIVKTEKFTLNLADHLIITTPPVVSRFQAVLRLAKHIYKAVEVTSTRLKSNLASFLVPYFSDELLTEKRPCY